MKTKVQADLLTAIRLRDQMTKQKMQCINTAYAMFNVHGIKIKKSDKSYCYAPWEHGNARNASDNCNTTI